ncbi:pathogenesis-related protein 1-like [Nymphaea colorata]|uniref:SCP domain-containing protein n=1 Tax=Nymphaea colorata TaxID=210225 RepID=A0A5K1GIF7_9MAGN|nr:pathogenesis-related protein 1-like [Nymphaea colorata]
MKCLSCFLLLALVDLALLLGLATNPSHAQNSPQDFLDPHNAARAAVGVGPLAWDDTVASYAQAYADQRAADCALMHSGGQYGENIYWNSGDADAADAVSYWVSEEAYYDYNSNSCIGGECLHYTQVVWRDTMYLGCAKVTCDSGGTFITCNYDPPGNIIGERPY